MQDEYGWTALQFAAQSGDDRFIDLLLQHEGDILNNKNVSSFLIALANNNFLFALEVFYLAEYRNANRVTPLMLIALSEPNDDDFHFAEYILRELV